MEIFLWNWQTPPTQNDVKGGILDTFSHAAKYFFVSWDWFCLGNILQETQPDQFLRKHPNEPTNQPTK